MAVGLQDLPKSILETLIFDLYSTRIPRFGMKISAQIELVSTLPLSHVLQGGERSPEALDLNQQCWPKVDLHSPKILPQSPLRANEADKVANEAKGCHPGVGI